MHIQIHHEFRNALLLGCILCLGFAFRFYNLEYVPPGLWFDEAFYADEGIRVLQHGPRMVYFMRDEAQIGLFPMILAVGFWFFGDSLLAIRATMALWGFAGLIGCYLLSLELFLRSPQRKIIALGATFFLATSYWHLNFSRVAFSASLIPTIEILSFWLTLYTFRKNKVILAAVAALVTALGLYTYWSYYPFMLLPAAFALHHLYRNGRSALLVFVVYVGVGILTCVPLITAFIQYDMLARLRSTSNFSAQETSDFYLLLKEFFYHVYLHIHMLFVVGDSNWRHNLSGQPQLSPIVSLGLCLSLAVMIGQFIKLPTRSFVFSDAMKPLLLLLGWVFVAMLPAALSNQALPHALRALGMVVPCQILSAFGYAALIEYCYKRFQKPLFTRLSIVLLLVMVVYQTASVVYQYFIVFAHHPSSKEHFVLLDNSFLRHQFAKDPQ